VLTSRQSQGLPPAGKGQVRTLPWLVFGEHPELPQDVLSGPQARSAGGDGDQPLADLRRVGQALDAFRPMLTDVADVALDLFVHDPCTSPTLSTSRSKMNIRPSENRSCGLKAACWSAGGLTSISAPCSSQRVDHQPLWTLASPGLPHTSHVRSDRASAEKTASMMRSRMSASRTDSPSAAFSREP